MRIGIPRESRPGETLVAATAKTAAQLAALGYDVVVEAGAGIAADQPDSAYADAGVRVGTSADGVGQRHRREGQRPDRGGDRPPAQRVGHGHRAAGARPQPRAGRAARCGRCHRPRDGRGAADLARPVDGRAVLDGQRRRLPRRDRGRPRVRPALHRPGHRGRQGAAGPRLRRRCRCRRPRRDRCGRDRWAPSCAPSTYAPRWPSRSSRWARSSSRVDDASEEAAASRRLCQGDDRRAGGRHRRDVRRGGARRRHRHHHRADPRPPRAAAHHRRDRRRDGAGHGRGRHGRRQRRQRRRHRQGRADRHRQRRHRAGLHRPRRPPGRPDQPALRHQHRQPPQAADAREGRPAHPRHGRRRPAGHHRHPRGRARSCGRRRPSRSPPPRRDATR